MAKHRCAGDDCPVCQDIAEERAARTFESRSDEEYQTRQAERRYEAQLFGRGL